MGFCILWGCVCSSCWRKWSDQGFSLSALHTNIYYFLTLKFYIIFQALLPRSRCVCKNCEVAKREFVSWECCPQLGWVSDKICLPEDSQDGYCESREVWGMLGMREMRTSEIFLSLSEECKLSHLFLRFFGWWWGPSALNHHFSVKNPTKLVFP